MTLYQEANTTNNSRTDSIFVGNIAWPLRTSGKHFVDSNGTPFLMVGTGAAQDMIQTAAPGDVTPWFAANAPLGYNTVIFGVGAMHVGTHINSQSGIPPFSSTLGNGSPDFTTPNEPYWQLVDQMISIANNYNFCVLLCYPAYVYESYQDMPNNGTSRCNTYGRFLGTRYANAGNILWLNGNDYNDHGYDAIYQSMSDGIKATDTQHKLHSLWNGEGINWWDNYIDFYSCYPLSPYYPYVNNDYQHSPSKPTIAIEVPYEGEGSVWGFPAGQPGTNWLRKQSFWGSPIAGSTSNGFYGSSGWYNTGDRSIWGWPGNLQTRYFTPIFAGRAWWNLVPDIGHTVVTAGMGTRWSAGSTTVDTSNSDTYCIAAATSDGTLAMAYVPTSRTITVNMASLSIPTYAKAINPTNDAITSLGGPFANTGSRDFTMPGSHTDGSDWVFVLEATA